jgi:hypothetical protein
MSGDWYRFSFGSSLWDLYLTIVDRVAVDRITRSKDCQDFYLYQSEYSIVA